jgi:hypothetical protein
MNIPGGYILFARRFIEILADMPLLDRALWVWLYCKANHGNHAGLGRGELLTTISEMQRAMRYQSGCAFKNPSRYAVWRALRRLCGRSMAATHKTTRGLVVTICDYDLYQHSANYGGSADAYVGAAPGAPEAQHDKQECNKNDKNEKREPSPSFLKGSFVKTFDEMDCERARRARLEAIKEFLADGKDSVHQMV